MLNRSSLRSEPTISRILEPLESRVMFSTWVVTNNADAGAGSLRWAINKANADLTVSTINFKLPAVQLTIHPLSDLPALTHQVTVNGASQPGYAGTPLVRIDGSIAGFDGLIVDAGNSTIRGLSITGFADFGISVDAPSISILGNYVGLAPSGVAAGNHHGGVLVAFQDHTTIGGPALADRNLISANYQWNILVTGGNYTRIGNNYVGTAADGLHAPKAIHNGTTAGIEIDAGGFGPGQTSHGNLVGGTASWQRNVISANQGDGILLGASSSAIVVLGNYIGADATGAHPLGNGGDGVRTRGQFNRIGNLAKGGGNVIAFNGTSTAIPHTAGVGIEGIGAAANQVSGNSIFLNRGLGIDIGSDGLVDPIDHLDPDAGPNGRQNRPVLFAALHTSAGTVVSGALDGIPGFTFRIEFFASPVADPSGFGEGARYLGSTLVAIPGGGGPIAFTATLGVVPAGWVVSATATDTGPGNTSEFSGAIAVK